jgi:hypothetical protein
MNNKVNFLANNQVWYRLEKKIVFQSYETVVCEITNFEKGNEPVIKITEGQPQSKTTAKYLNQFLQLHTSFKSYKEII